MKKTKVAIASFLTFASLSLQGSNHLFAAASGGLTLLENADAKFAALGEAGTAGSNEIGVMNYNPAGLATLKTGQASFLFQKGMIGDSFGRFMVGSPMKKGTVGLSVGHYSAGDLELEENGQTRSINAQKDYALGFAYGRTWRSNQMGLKINYLRSTLAEQYSAQTIALDFGMQAAVTSRLRMGAAIQNLGKGLTYLSATDPLPTTYRAGATYALSVGKTAPILFIDAAYLKNEKDLRPAIGLDVPFGPLSLRGGVRDNGTSNEFSMGTGFTFGSSTLDYAFGLASELESTHRVSLSVGFGKSAPPAFVKRPTPLAPAKTAKVVEIKPAAPKQEAIKSASAAVATSKRDIYTVKPNDTLSSIAKQKYGNPLMWNYIYSANKHIIDDPKTLEAGIKLVLP